MQALRLLDVDRLDTRIAHCGGSTMSAGQFVTHVEHVAAALPAAANVINLSENRYLFLVGWVAASLRGQVTLLPPGHTDAVLARLREEYPDHHTIDDALLERLVSQAGASTSESVPANWQLPAERVVAIAFTSGSTGRSAPHPKTWGSLYHNSRLAAFEVLGGGNRTLVSTVPPQHMFGLEVSLLSALTARSQLFDGKPFYPADVRRALEATTGPRVLVTTPAHLKVLVDAAVGLPPIERVVSATAVLPVELARKVEAAWNTQLMEIYGCTEAGVMAKRRTTQSEIWRTFEGGTMTTAAGATEYFAPQLPGPVPLQDLLDLRSPTEFFLRGRGADMIKVAGKRASLQELTRHILALPGVKDAVVFLPDSDTRPAAAVVAPGLTAAGILRELRTHLDGVFVPRPLIMVDELPRNAAGKLPREKLLGLLEMGAPNSAFTSEIVVPANHPSLPGHFPGRPIVPAVVLLDAVLATIRTRGDYVLRSIAVAKFLRPVLPDEPIELRVRLTTHDAAQLRASFEGRRNATLAFEGSFIVFTGSS